MDTPPTTRKRSLVPLLALALLATTAFPLAPASVLARGKPAEAVPSARAHVVAQAPEAKPSYQLVALAAPEPADAAGQAPDALSYRLVEIFAGEPESTDVAIRHEGLTAEDRANVVGMGTVIVLANRATDGRTAWVGPLPIRATASATEAFRRWSAPADVRVGPGLTDVIAEAATDVTIAPRGERPPPPSSSPAPVATATPPSLVASLPAVAPSAPAIGAPRVVDAPVPGRPAAITLPVAPLAREPQAARSAPSAHEDSQAPVDASAEPARQEPATAVATVPAELPEVPINRLERRAPLLPFAEATQPVEAVDDEKRWSVPPLAEPPTATRANPPDRRSSTSLLDAPEPPLSYAPKLLEMPGPGLPPAPPAAQHLGPPMSARSDLRRPDEYRARFVR